jgi:hypothetical protein
MWSLIGAASQSSAIALKLDVTPSGRHPCRVMRLVLATAVLALGLSGSAQAATKWRLSGTLTGTYDSNVTWEQCATGATGAAVEHADVDVRLKPKGVFSYERGDASFLATYTADVGGRWTLDGSYAPQSRDANGNESCGAPVPIACRGALVNPYPAPSLRSISFERRGRAFVGQFGIVAPIREDFAGQSSACDPSSGDETFAARPLFGLANGAPGRFVDYLYHVPVARVLGHRAFSVRVTPVADPTTNCGAVYRTCSEDIKLALTLTFRPA